MTNRPARPPEPIWEYIPEELKVLKQWTGWRRELVGGRWTKVPIQPDGSRASSTDPRTWAPFEFAQCAYFHLGLDGVGFVLNGGIVAVDLDHVVDSNRKITLETAAWLRSLNSYTEVSPSGAGLRILLFGKLPPQDRRLGNIEMYSDKRFVSVTGQRLPRAPQCIEHRQREIEQFHAEIFKNRVARRAAQSLCATRASSVPVTRDDAALLDRARRAANGSRFSLLYDAGQWQGLFPSQSEADAWLCSRLAFWTRGDLNRVDSLFRRSALMRLKWDREDYRTRTLSLAAA